MRIHQKTDVLALGLLAVLMFRHVSVQAYRNPAGLQHLITIPSARVSIMTSVRRIRSQQSHTNAVQVSHDLSAFARQAFHITSIRQVAYR